MQVKDPARRFVPWEYVSVTEHDGVIGDRTALPARCGREGERLVEREATLFIALDVSAFCKVLPSVGGDFGQRVFPPPVRPPSLVDRHRGGRRPPPR
jgi:hypothetical protein